jgi:uncharacterized C2H2 Zn-finger protein
MDRRKIYLFKCPNCNDIAEFYADEFGYQFGYLECNKCGTFMEHIKEYYE